MLTDAEIELLVGQIAAQAQATRVILFGSYAKGTATIRSDLDLLVVKNTDLPMARRADDLMPLAKTVVCPIDIHVYTPEELDEYGKEAYSFVETVLTTGRTVFEVCGPQCETSFRQSVADHSMAGPGFA
jgi:predicted nucleotidyltransferase